MGELTITGGAGGFQASYEDMLTQARVMKETGDVLVGQSRTVGAIAAASELLESGIIVPDRLPITVAKIGLAATGPDGLLVVGGSLSVSGRVTEGCLQTYEAIDRAAREVFDRIQLAAGYAVGAALVPVALVGAGGLALLAARNPALAAALASRLDGGAILSTVDRTLYDHPWLTEALTRMLPGAIPAFANTLAGPFSPLLQAATGGRWPPSSYEDSLSGLIALLGHGGLLQDNGSFTVGDPTGPPREVSLTADNAVESLFDQQELMDTAWDPDQQAWVKRDDWQKHSQVQILTVYDEQGDAQGYVVQLPGTEDWGLERGSNLTDMTSNIRMMAQHQTVSMAVVVEALERAGIEPGSGVPLMLSGHSQGGITAAALASDPAFVDDFTVTSVLTGGAPVGRMPIDEGVQVLSMEHEQDPVTMLDGTHNPDRANWTTVRRDLPPEESAPPSGTAATASGAHYGHAYADTGRLVDGSDDPSIAAWRASNEPFFSGSRVEAVQYDVIREDAG